MDQNKLPLEPHHLGVPSGAFKTISEPMYVWRKPCTYLLLTLTPSTNGAKEIPHDPRHLGVPSGASKTISEPMVHSAQTVHRSYVKISTISKRIEMSFHFSLVTKEYHQVCPKRFLSLCYVLAQTMHLSCIDTNTVSKRTERSFHFSLATKEYHQVCPK